MSQKRNAEAGFSAKRSPLPAGTLIEYCGERAVIVSDDGDNQVTVEVDGSIMRWWWRFDGVECQVVGADENEHSDKPSQ